MVLSCSLEPVALAMDPVIFFITPVWSVGCRPGVGRV